MQKQIHKLILVLVIISGSLANAQNSYPFLGDFTDRLGEEDPPTSFDFIPDTFPRLDLPAHFLFESATSHHGTQRLILNTPLTRAATLEQLITVIESAGFVDFHELAGRELNNFIVAARMKYSRSYCRDDVGYLTIEMQDQGVQTRVTLSNLGKEALVQFISCTHEANRKPGFMINAHEIRQWMQDAPVLHLPDTAIEITPPVVGDTYNSAFSYQSNTEIRLNIAMEQLYQLLAAQVLQQGWTLDSESIGQISATSNWLKGPSDNTPLLATVILTQRSNSIFIIRLRTTQLDASGY